jgi:hypothetical protein
MTTLILSPQCQNCARLREVRNGRWVCQAFPGGIPLDIIKGQFDHTGPHVGDHGLRYEPRKGQD